MKRIVNFCWLIIFLLGAGSLWSYAQTSATPPDQSLGDFARSVKKDKKPTKTFDNDNIPTQDTLSVVGNSSTQTADAQAPAQDQSTDANSADGANKAAAPGKHAPKADNPQVTPGESQEDRQKVFDKWQDKLSDQQQKVNMISREIDVMQREQKMRAAEFYSDAGARLRDSSNWDKQQSEYQQQLQEKQKALADAKDAMGDMQEDARKSGVPSSVIEKTDSPQN